MANTTFLQIEKFEERDALLEIHLNERLMDGVDTALGGYLTISLAGLSGATLPITGGTVTNAIALTPTQAKYARIKFTGNPSAALTLLIPSTTGALARIEFVNACGGSTSTVKIKSLGANTANTAGVSIATGYSQLVSHDGESAYYVGRAVTPGGGAVSTPRAHIYHSTTQALASGSEAPLAFNSELLDTDGQHDNVTNNTRLTCKVAGEYRISGQMRIAAHATGLRYIYLRLNGSGGTLLLNSAVILPSAGGSQATALPLVYRYTFALNDYIEVMAFQDSGVSQNVLGCYLAWEQIG